MDEEVVVPLRKQEEFVVCGYTVLLLVHVSGRGNINAWMQIVQEPVLEPVYCIILLSIPPTQRDTQGQDEPHVRKL